jgi:hypothetical protein
MHYMAAVGLGLDPTLHLDLGWGYVTVYTHSALEAFAVGIFPMTLEAYAGVFLIHRALRMGGAASLGLGLDFSFNLASSLMQFGQWDFWYLWELEMGWTVAIVLTTAASAGMTADPPIRLMPSRELCYPESPKKYGRSARGPQEAPGGRGPRRIIFGPPHSLGGGYGSHAGGRYK